MNDAQHAVRMALVLAGVGAVALFVRSLLVPPTFGLFGTYRGAAVQEIMDQPVKYQGVENCRSCHDPQWKEWRKAGHKSVACETCHGPGMEHSEPDVDPKDRPKILGTRELMAHSHDLCLSCHAKTPGRPADFPQVDFVKHLGRYDIREKGARYEGLGTTRGSTVSTQEAESEPAPLPEEYSCNFCHGEDGTLAGNEDTEHLIVTEEHLAGDIHWRRGLQCHDCHGGNPKLDDYVNHRDDTGFRPLPSPDKVAEFCGHCHFDADSMRRYRPSPRIDEVVAYLTNRHGRRLEKGEDGKPATCVTCHGHHAIRAIVDQGLPVNCVPCHRGHTPAR